MAGNVVPNTEIWFDQLNVILGKTSNEYVSFSNLYSFTDGVPNSGSVSINDIKGKLPRGKTFFRDDFETFTGWEQYLSGTVEQSSNLAKTGTYSLRKFNAADPSGGYKLTGKPFGRNFRLEAWCYDPGSRSGSGDRIAVLDSNFNGYGFSTNETSIYVDRRDNGVSTFLGSNAWTRPLQQWYYISLETNSNNTFTVSGYDEKRNLLQSLTSAMDTTYSNFDRVCVQGGIAYHVDNLRLSVGDTKLIRDGTSPARANASAYHIRKAVLDAGGTQKDVEALHGPLWIDPAYFSSNSVTPNPMLVYCDMITEGGGWTLAIKYDRSNATPSLYSLARDGGVAYSNTGSLSNLDGMPITSNLYATLNMRHILQTRKNDTVQPLMMHCCTDVALDAKHTDYIGHNFSNGPFVGSYVNNTVGFSPLFSGFMTHILSNPDLLWDTTTSNITNQGSGACNNIFVDMANPSDVATYGGGFFWKVGTPETPDLQLDKYVGGDLHDRSSNAYVCAPYYKDGIHMFGEVNREGATYFSGRANDMVVDGHLEPKINWGWFSQDGTQQTFYYGPYAIGTHCYPEMNSNSRSPAKQMNYMFIR